MNKQIQVSTGEYDAHLKRNKKPYSVGHQVMYQFPIALMRGKKFRILDVGFGIGCGLDWMLQADVIDYYLGYEPEPKSFRFVEERYRHKSRIKLRNESFSGATETFDHVFCIEVIEHVHKTLHRDFIRMLRGACVGTLWISTPDASREPHGVVTRDEMVENLKPSFPNITVHEEQWTTMYVAQ